MNKSFKFTILGVVLLAFVAIISLSYAFFTLVIEGDEVSPTKGSAKTTDPKITLIEKNGGITLNETYPMTDSLGLTSEPYVYTIKNEEDKIVNVSVVLEVESGSTLSNSLVNVALNNDVSKLTSGTFRTPSESKYSSAYVISNISLGAKETKKMEFRVWINEDGTIENAQNKTWASKLLFVPAFS